MNVFMFISNLVWLFNHYMCYCFYHRRPLWKQPCKLIHSSDILWVHIVYFVICLLLKINNIKINILDSALYSLDSTPYSPDQIYSSEKVFQNGPFCFQGEPSVETFTYWVS
jgi:hypothetical protein